MRLASAETRDLFMIHMKPRSITPESVGVVTCPLSLISYNLGGAVTRCHGYFRSAPTPFLGAVGAESGIVLVPVSEV